MLLHLDEMFNFIWIAQQKEFYFMFNPHLSFSPTFVLKLC